MFKNFIKGFNAGKEIAQRGIFWRPNIIQTINHDVGTIFVVHDEASLIVKNLRIAAAGNLGEAFAIIVDDNFMELSQPTKEFIIQHEIGHLVNSHVYTMKKFIKRNMSSKVSDDEREADEYSCLKVGKENTISALKEILRIEGIRKKEIVRRIKLIELGN